ncbi:hypothetical protein [Streptomyces xanthii]|uniref:Uncharacterized protein n=1 Tax=Streptomyces xanthii TaxID=2768069 RepID=A0A7H1B9H1_9ACTN|nr:hypothetical protein [Streptomyces xanthii]QNS05376.1 hypothetical protein IAG42_18415 [Streptomyces xanthii]
MTPEQVHHAYAHETHAAELRSEAAEFRRAAGLRTGLRTRLGLTLVTLGTRLAAVEPARVAAGRHVTPCA